MRITEAGTISVGGVLTPHSADYLQARRIGLPHGVTLPMIEAGEWARREATAAGDDQALVLARVFLAMRNASA